MKTRAKGAQVQKAGKAPDPGAYGEDDITPEDRKRAKDAKAQAADGTNPPSWVVDESIWEKAKEAADKSYDEGDDAYWPAVVHIYGNMGGEIQAAAKKAEHAHADMADVVEMMNEYDISEADMIDASGLDTDRVKALLHGGEKPTDAELDAMTEACEDYAEGMDKSFEWVDDEEFDDDEPMVKHGEHDQSTHAGGGGGKKPSGGKGRSPKTAIKTSARAAGSLARDLANPEHARIAESLEGHLREAAETGSKAALNRASKQLARLARAAGTEDKNVTRSIARIKDNIASAKGAKTRKSISAGVESESLLKAGLGMSDGEFRRMLLQAVHARWGKQAAVDEVYGDCDVAIIKAWEGDAWASGHRLICVPFDRENGIVTLGDVDSEVHQTYEPVAKSADVEPNDLPCEVEYIADRDKRGEYVIDGLNGEAVTLAKSLADAGVSARVENDIDGKSRVVFASRGATCKQLAVRATVDGEFESRPRSFVPYLRNEVLIQKAEERGIVYAIVYEPDVVDKQGEWATADDIEEAAHEYLRKSRRMKRQHDEHSDSEVVESSIAQADYFLGNRMVRKGSWVVAVKLGETAKKLYKEGRLTGVSMGGHASYAA